MDSKAAQTTSSRNKLCRIARAMGVILACCFICYTLMQILVIATSLFAQNGYAVFVPDTVFSLVALICEIVANGLVLLVFTLVLHTIGKGRSPFSDFTVRALVACAVLLAIAAIASSFAPPFDVGATGNGNTFMVHSSNLGNGTLYLNARGMIEAFICFALAATFRYGSMLQDEVNDLV